MRGERPAEDSSGHGACGSSPHARGTRNPRHSRRLDYRFIPACAGNAYPQCARRRPAAVHPRMRGERLNSIRDIGYNLGSSPHARGTHIDSRRDRGRQRFIPACAGNARTRSARLPGRAVHPRMRGERMVADDHSSVAIGSSPHARGTHATPVFPLVVLRFIPACAGNASLSSSSITPMTVHPRMRGERVDPLHDHDDG